MDLKKKCQLFNSLCEFGNMELIEHFLSLISLDENIILESAYYAAKNHNLEVIKFINLNWQYNIENYYKEIFMKIFHGQKFICDEYGKKIIHVAEYLSEILNYEIGCDSLKNIIYNIPMSINNTNYDLLNLLLKFATPENVSCYKILLEKMSHKYNDIAFNSNDQKNIDLFVEKLPIFFELVDHDEIFLCIVEEIEHINKILPLIPNVGQNTTLKYFEKLLEKILISDYCSNKTFDIILQSYSNIATNYDYTSFIKKSIKYSNIHYLKSVTKNNLIFDPYRDNNKMFYYACKKSYCKTVIYLFKNYANSDVLQNYDEFVKIINNREWYYGGSPIDFFIENYSTYSQNN